jgi:hypothetical protein
MGENQAASPWDLIEPLTLEQRKARGFCTCAVKSSGGADTSADSEPCRVHPRDVVHSAEHNQSHGLLFFDDRRNRHVTWPDAVEGMRQPRYAGANSKMLVLYTWVNLVRLLEALCEPTREPAAQVTEESAERLIAIAGARFPPDALAGLISFARGGGTAALCTIFRTLGRESAGQRAAGEGTA